jgi:hypothetical protein
MDKACSTQEKRNAHWNLFGKPEEKISLRTRRCRCEDNTKIDLREIGWDYMDWIHVVEYRDQRRTLVKTVMNLRVL